MINQILSEQLSKQRIQDLDYSISSMQLFLTDIRDEVRSVRKDFDELRGSLEFSQSQLKDTEDKVMNHDCKVGIAKLSVKEQGEWLDYVEEQVEYIGNQSRRHNIKIMEIEEDKEMEQSWDDTEKIVSDVICKKLRIQETLHIERAHRVGKQMSDSHDGSKNRPRPIIAKFTYWKQKEKALRAARELKPEGVQFYADFAKRTLQRRASQIPKLLVERKKGKVAYFVMDQLIVKDKPADIQSQSSDNEVFSI